MCASSRIPTSVPHDFAWRMALVAMPCLLQGGALLGTLVLFALLRRLRDELSRGGDAMMLGASVVGSAYSRLPRARSTFRRSLIMRAGGLRWRARRQLPWPVWC